MSRPTRLVIDLKALRFNYQLCQQLAPQSQNMAVIKANAYGHGMVAVAKALSALAPAFAVACLQEAITLRKAGISTPILLLGGFFEASELAIIAENKLWLMVSNQHQVSQLSRFKSSQSITVWLKIDTGMHRLGIAPQDTKNLYKQLSQCPSVASTPVLASHFSCADELNNTATPQQINCFLAASAGLNAPISLANSAALLAWPASHGDWNRPGYMLYGGSPFSHPQPQADKLQAVMVFESQIMALRTVTKGEFVGYGSGWQAPKDSLIATLPVGYGDGYPRHANSNTPVLINGKAAPLAGRVSMDLLTVDVSDIAAVKVGDRVELWGKNLSVDNVARSVGTIGYELLTRMPTGGRLPRVYVG